MGKIDDPARWERILDYVVARDAQDALWLARLLEPPARVAQRHKRTRAEALRAARPVIAPDKRIRPAAAQIAQELGRYLASAWTTQRHLPELPPEAFERHRVLHRVAVLTDGNGLGWGTIYAALRGD